MAVQMLALKTVWI